MHVQLRWAPASRAYAVSRSIAERKRTDPATARVSKLTAERGLSLFPFVFLAGCGGGGGSPQSTPLPPAPPITSQPDTTTVAVGSATATGNVLANDTTSGGAQLSVIAVSLQGGPVGTVGQPVQGKLGQLTIEASGAYNYAVGANAPAFTALAAGQTATEVFTYTSSAGGVNGNAQTLTVTVTGVNDAPIAQADNGGAITAGAGPITGNVLANDSDPDNGAVITVTGVRAGSGQTSQSVQVGQAASSLEPVVGIYGKLSMNADGSYTYTVDAADSDTRALAGGHDRTEVFTYTVFDGSISTTGMLTFTVTGVNDTPVASDDAYRLSANAGTIFGNAFLNDNDPDGNAGLRLAEFSSGQGPTVAAGQSVTGAFGTFSMKRDGTWSYSVDQNNIAVLGLRSGQTAEDRFSYTVTDGTAQSTATIVMTIEGLEDAPRGPQEQKITISRVASAPLNPVPPTDPDSGDVLDIEVWQIIANGELRLADGTAVKVGRHLTREEFEGLRFAPTSHGVPGAFDQVHYTVTDSTGRSDFGVLQIYVRENEVNGTAGADVLVGDIHGDTIRGLGGNDRLEGLTGDDTLIGGDGDDVLIGGAGFDLLDGGRGADTYQADVQDIVSYRSAPAPVVVALDGSRPREGEAADDTYSDVYGIEGTDYDDTLIGDAESNRLNGGRGNDILIGGDGRTKYEGSDLSDILDGGDGDDLIYGFKPNGTPSAGTPNLTGADGQNELFGRAGNDVIYGGDGTNFIYGGDGDDNLYGGEGNNYFEGGSGADIITGGSAQSDNTASYYRSAMGVSVDLTLGTAAGGDAQGDVLVGILDLVGSSAGDVLVGNAARNELYGGLGNDRIEGQGGGDRLNGDDGDDQIFGGDGDDNIIGGVGADAIDGGDGNGDAVFFFDGLIGGVVVNLTTGTGSRGEAEGDTYVRVERVKGTSSDDVLIGNEIDNWLDGTYGDDRLEGRGGDDLLAGGTGADVLDGGDGVDTADYGFFWNYFGTFISDFGAVRVDLRTGEGRGSTAEGDRLSNIENLNGSDEADILIGNAAANVLDGRDGNDILAGAGGTDRLVGAGGDDLLLLTRGTAEGNSGADVLVALEGASGLQLLGGAGADTFVIEGSRDRDGGGVALQVVVGDMELGADKIDLADFRKAGGGLLDIDALRAAATDTGPDIVVDLGAFRKADGGAVAGSLTLTGVANITSLTAGHFLFTGGVDWEAKLPTDLAI